MVVDVLKEKLIHKGAEARLFYGHWFEKEVIFKHRIPKKYRIESLDKKIRTIRTLNEARALIKVKEYGINTPQVYEIDIKNSIIIMKYISGEKLKNLIKSIADKKREHIFNRLGRIVAILHINGHIHGDITTSNVIIDPNDEIFLIDFGLHEYSDSIEDKSVDLHLLKRVLISSHGSNYKLCFNAFIDGYYSEYTERSITSCNEIIKNISIIETRGRYIKKEDRLL
ncbi:MAG: KEOPS complex kinase/ATPase Bud32 [Candidatus Hermodarchaeota archaeon]